MLNTRRFGACLTTGPVIQRNVVSKSSRHRFDILTVILEVLVCDEVKTLLKSKIATIGIREPCK